MTYPSGDKNIKPWALLQEDISKRCKEILEVFPGNRACKYALHFLETEEGKNLSDKGEI